MSFRSYNVGYPETNNGHNTNIRNPNNVYDIIYKVLIQIITNVN